MSLSLWSKSSVEKEEIFTALDIGTSKVVCLVGKFRTGTLGTQNERPELSVLGIGYYRSLGVKGGRLVNLEALEGAILSAVQSAEESSKETLRRVYVNIPTCIASFHTIESEISLSHHLVDDYHLNRLLNVSRGNFFTPDQYVLHVFPLSYTLDGVQDLRDPRSMVGQKLSALLYVVTAPAAYVRNIMNVMGRCQLDISGFVLSSYASGLSTLVADELELGATLIEIGGGYTGISCFYEGRMVFSTFVPLGGINVTHDIARGLSTPLTQAERLKTLHGNVIASSDDQEPIFVIPMEEEGGQYALRSRGGAQAALQQGQPQPISPIFLNHIIRSRMDELFELIRIKLESAAVDPVVFHRIILTGGTANLQNLKDLVKSFFGHYEVRIGKPNSDLVDNPLFGCSTGMLYYAAQEGMQTQRIPRPHSSGMFGRMQGWIKGRI